MNDSPSIPSTGFMRISEVLTVIPISRSSWWAGVKSGRYPKPVKLSARVTAWRVGDIRALVDAYSKTDHEKMEAKNG